MATSGACEGRLWLRGWCLRTRSLREQINTAAPCTWTFLPLRRLVPSPFLSVFISRRFSGLRVCSSFSPFLLLPLSLSLVLLSSSSLRRDPYRALPPTQVIRNPTRFLPIFLVFPIGFSLSFAPGASLCLARESVSSSFSRRTPPGFIPVFATIAGAVPFAFVSPRGIFLP